MILFASARVVTVSARGGERGQQKPEGGERRRERTLASSARSARASLFNIEKSVEEEELVVELGVGVLRRVGKVSRQALSAGPERRTHLKVDVTTAGRDETLFPVHPHHP